MHTEALTLDDAEKGIRNHAMFFMVSVAGHLIFFLLLIVFQNASTGKPYKPAVINVDLVSFSAPSPKTPEPAPKSATEAPPEKPAPVSKPAPVKIKPTLKKKTQAKKIKPKRSLKKKTFKSSKVVENAIAKVQKKVETSQSQQLQDRLAQLSQEVKTTGKERGRTGRMNMAGSQGSELINIYKTEILYYIQKNWSYNPQLSGGQPDLVALLGIKIMPDGEIREVWFDRHSGDSYFDESARKAVLKSNPLPPLPEGFNNTFLNQGLRFTPSGVK